SSNSEILVPTNSADLGSSAPPGSTPTPIPIGTPGATPTPVSGPAMSLSTTFLNFGNQPFGSKSAMQIITITNSGTASLNINFTSINSSYFSEDYFADTCRVMIDPGQSCDIGISFDAYITISTTGIFKIESNAINSPVLVQLQG